MLFIFVNLFPPAINSSPLCKMMRKALARSLVELAARSLSRSRSHTANLTIHLSSITVKKCRHEYALNNAVDRSLIRRKLIKLLSHLIVCVQRVVGGVGDQIFSIENNLDIWIGARARSHIMQLVTQFSFTTLYWTSARDQTTCCRPAWCCCKIHRTCFIYILEQKNLHT